MLGSLKGAEAHSIAAFRNELGWRDVHLLQTAMTAL
jgi:hypothetical protein